MLGPRGTPDQRLDLRRADLAALQQVLQIDLAADLVLKGP